MKTMKKLFLTVLSMSALMVSACSQGIVNTSSTTPTPSSNPSGSTSAPTPTSSGGGGDTSTSAQPEVSITLDKTTATIKKGETATITATATGGTVVWTSNDETVATVSGGVITAVEAGYTRIYASIGEYSVTCAVTVIEDEPEPGPAPTPAAAVGGIIIKNGETWDDPISVALYNNPDKDNEVEATNVSLEKDQEFYIVFDNETQYRHYYDLKPGGAASSFAAVGEEMNFKVVDSGVYSFYIERVSTSQAGTIWVEGVKTAPTFEKYTVAFGEDGEPIELSETTLDENDTKAGVLKKYTAEIESVTAGALIQFAGDDNAIAPGDENEAGAEKRNENNTVGTYPYFYVHNDAENAAVYLKIYPTGYSFWLTGYNEEAQAPVVPPNPIPIDEAASYYLVGKIDGVEDWETGYPLEENKALAEGEEYFAEDVALKAGDKIKVKSSTNAYYPDGFDTEYTITADGEYDIYFRPAGNSDWAAFGGYFYLGKESSGTDPEPEPTETRYYIKGTMNGWNENPEFLLGKDENDESKYYIKLNLVQGDQFKIYSTASSGTWYPTENVPYKYGNGSALEAGYLTALTGGDLQVVLPGYYFVEIKVSGEGAGIWTSLEKDEEQKLLVDTLYLEYGDDSFETTYKPNEEGTLQFEYASETGTEFAKDAEIGVVWQTRDKVKLILGDTDATEELLSLGEDHSTLTVLKAAHINLYFVLGPGTVTVYAAEAGGSEPVVPTPTEVTYAATINETAVADLADKAIEKESNTWAYRFNELKEGDKVVFTANAEGLTFVQYNETKKIAEPIDKDHPNEYTVTEDGDYNFFYKEGEGIYVAKAAEQLKGVVTLYFSNSFGDGGVNAYAWKSTDETHKNHDWPGVAMTDTGARNEYNQKIYEIEIDLSEYDRLILNGSGKQTVDMDVSALTLNAFFLDGSQDGSGHYNCGMWNYVPANE